jgi:hypothetical protein
VDDARGARSPRVTDASCGACSPASGRLCSRSARRSSAARAHRSRSRWCDARASARAVTVAAVTLAAWVATIAPWTYRNWVVFDRFVPVSTGDLGYSLYLGTFESNTNWTGWHEFPEAIFASPEQKQAVLAERDRSSRGRDRQRARGRAGPFFKTLALERIAADPLGWLLLGLRRLPRLWFQFYIPCTPTRRPRASSSSRTSGSRLGFVAVERDVRLRCCRSSCCSSTRTRSTCRSTSSRASRRRSFPSLLCLSAIGLYFAQRAASRGTGSRSAAGIASAEPP